ncbi:hypothetical protein F5884DRAFT_786507 [Xylogone sp. PMI_703]|nr:hypothetical protein F5884DRAFT_786507 [Xylogone sp. PMI_703]
MISVIMSCLILKALIARLISEIITQYLSWRNVYWMSFGLQVAMITTLLFMFHDYPVLSPGTSRPRILLKIITLPFHDLTSKGIIMRSIDVVVALQ